MKCPNCNAENNEGAKFCKKCGTPLEKKANSHEKMINSMNNEKKSDNTKIIIAALIIIAVVLAGAFIYLQGFGSGSHSQDSPSQNNASNAASQSNASNQASSSQASPSQSNEQKTATPQSTSMKIQGGSFSTGSADADKTYAQIYVGKENAGQSVIVQIFYSRDGNSLNNGNMVPANVHSDGYLYITSADAYLYYPDYATIKLYDSNSNLMDTQSVSLTPTSGTQYF